jgi:mRNA-degrading endonuclease RelE of RelBE toxin-antitoxin system
LLDENLKERVRERLKKLANEPRGGPNITALSGVEGYRVRVGRARALFLVKDKVRQVRVTRIVLRDEKTYK